MSLKPFDSLAGVDGASRPVSWSCGSTWPESAVLATAHLRGIATNLVNLFTCERCIARHKEMTSRGRYQACDDTDEVVVHVRRIAESLGRSSHDGGDLKDWR